MHVKAVPKSLSNIEGLIASDLAAAKVNLAYDPANNTYTCVEKPGSEQADTSFANMISSECSQVAKELLEEFVVLGSSSPEGDAGEPGQPGFPRHSR